jgi:protocatechuate 3,4-dioxygenase beta subunit
MKRRTFIKSSTLTVFSVAAFGTINWNGKNFEADNETTTDILGPFYRPGAPMRTDIIPPGSAGDIMHLYGTIFQQDGKTPLANTLIEVWQCDQNEHYDNTSDEYIFRGAVKTGKDGKYAFKTMVPVPYRDGDGWRPAHIHLRISSADYQDLITQIYFKGDPHIAEDTAAASPQSVNRILEIKKNSSNENAVKFDIVMGKSHALDETAYRKITGLYKLNSGMAEFYHQDDLLFLKLNGQIMEALVYKGDNSFEGGMGFNKVKFELLSNGDVKAKITMWNSWSADNKYLRVYEGIKVLKYSN